TYRMIPIKVPLRCSRWLPRARNQGRVVDDRLVVVSGQAQTGGPEHGTAGAAEAGRRCAVDLELVRPVDIQARKGIEGHRPCLGVVDGRADANMSVSGTDDPVVIRVLGRGRVERGIGGEYQERRLPVIAESLHANDLWSHDL